MIKSLEVLLWGQKVGDLVSYNHRYKESSCFYYDKDFMRLGIDPSPTYNSINNPGVRKGMPVYAECDKMYSGLPAFVSDSLPDHWGNKLFSEWARTKGIRSKDLTSLDRLAYIGSRGMGALEFFPPTEPRLETEVMVDVNELYLQSRIALESARSFRVASIPELVMESLFRVGTSAGGRRPKALINIDLGSGLCYSGQVAPKSNKYLPSIIKFDESGQMPTTRIEYSYYLMALDAGMVMNSSRLLEIENNAHFLTARFDRNGGEKIHMQTLAALCPGSDSYEDLFRICCCLGIKGDSLNRVFRAMVMNAICGNVDDHNKNFTFLMDKNGLWSVAPTYDFTFSVDVDAPRYVNTQSLTISGKNSNIQRGDLLDIAYEYCIKNPDGIIDNCISTASDYQKYAESAGVDERSYLIIANEIAERLEILDAPRMGMKR